MNTVQISEFPLLETENYILRELNEKDAEAIFSYFSDDDVTKYYDFDSYKNIEQAINFVNSRKKAFIEGRGIRFGITDKNDSTKVIGTIGFHNWNKNFYKAEIGYELSKEYWGKGVMSETLPHVIDYGFSQMMLNRIEALFHPENIGSKRVLEKAGFKYEGTLDEYVYLKGKFLDTSIMSLLKKNYKGTSIERGDIFLSNARNRKNIHR